MQLPLADQQNRNIVWQGVNVIQFELLGKPFQGDVAMIRQSQQKIQLIFYLRLYECIKYPIGQ
jgi:hypothetical protein